MRNFGLKISKSWDYMESIAQDIHPSSTAAASSEGDNSDDCVICLAPISERAIIVPCNHCVFDFACLAYWLGAQPTCPLCRCFDWLERFSAYWSTILSGKAKVIAVEYDWRSPEDFKTFRITRSQSNEIPSEHEFRNAFPRRQRPTTRDHDYETEVDISLLRRRNVYRYQRYSLHVGSNPISGFQNITPDMVASSSKLQSRAKTWIRRELRAFNLSQSSSLSQPRRELVSSARSIEYLLEYIVEILKVTDIKGGRAEELLTEYLKENSPLFLHELSSWLRSPFDRLEDWDKFVQYHRPEQAPRITC